MQTFIFNINFYIIIYNLFLYILTLSWYRWTDTHTHRRYVLLNRFMLKQLNVNLKKSMFLRVTEHQYFLCTVHNFNVYVYHVLIFNLEAQFVRRVFFYYPLSKIHNDNGYSVYCYILMTFEINLKKINKDLKKFFCYEFNMKFYCDFFNINSVFKIKKK